MGCNKETGRYRLWECGEGRRSRLRWRRRWWRQWWGWQWCDNQWHIPSCNLHSACCPKEGSASKEPSSRCNWGWTDAGCVDPTNINACYQAVSPAEAEAESCCKLFSVNSFHEHKQKALCIILVPICNFQGLASRSDKLFGQIFEKNCLALLPKQYKNSDFMAELFAYSAFERPLLEKKFWRKYEGSF